MHCKYCLDERLVRTAMYERNSVIVADHLSSHASSLLPHASLRMLLQVCDELVFEVKDSAVHEAERMVKTHMEQAAQLSVPLTVETGIGKQWGDAL